MQAITVPESGGPDALTLTEVPDRVAGPGELLLTVAAAGVNRADINQREGHYPSPPGAPPWPGLEVSGTIAAVGAGVEGWSVGDTACALLPAGGYATAVTVRASHALPIPAGVDLIDAAALPETMATVWSNLVMLAGLRAGETLLVHGGSSGIGTTAIQVAKALGATVAVTAGSPEKLEACRTLGADILIDYRTQDYVERMLAETDGRGADVVLDPVGGAYLARNIDALAPHGRIVLIANLSGEDGSVSVRRLMGKWGTIHGTTLRARTDEEKDEIIRELRAHAWPLVESGAIRPVIDSRHAFSDAARAHGRMESSLHVGKILLLP
ncbi:putative PIG3 family NAD(P)H quinone oxidoreductase [Homoserinimonas aerilata]|uniref:Putative PIG3 family NAD(P)H quinone oxidoreductase n=1 Tax=Homoserinimonas aerilata TaxID=1162970 RepID=A0A542YI77_9MICO|nr:NAD(P)H-quinone oxidoreductase [Homoserinimonas aerilata]TQL47807.1 putative PIG3 family NAD(P)H quinone oxidoreductase [Homoserinimonas aerilata]